MKREFEKLEVMNFEDGNFFLSTEYIYIANSDSDGLDFESMTKCEISLTQKL